MVLSGLKWRSWRVWGVVWVALLCLVTGVMIPARGSGPARTVSDSDGLPHTTVEVSTSNCGSGWDTPVPGVQVFDLHNTSDGSAEAYLENPKSQAVYGEVEDIGPG